MNLAFRQVSVTFAIKLVALTIIANVIVDQASQIAVIITTANMHVPRAFAAGLACNLLKPPNGRL
jgi:hypothetical protein